MDREPIERNGEKKPNMNPSGAVDPFTGIRPVGPVQSGDAEKGRGNWGMAARWFLLALLALVVLGFLAWAFN
jgi:hypothetical protein